MVVKFISKKSTEGSVVVNHSIINTSIKNIYFLNIAKIDFDQKTYFSVYNWRTFTGAKLNNN